MIRYVITLALTTGLILAAAIAALLFPDGVRGDVGGVYSNVPWFEPEQVVTITVTAEDDDGTLRIRSSLEDSELTATNCAGIGSDQDAGQCDGSGMDAVDGQASDLVRIDTDEVDDDDDAELLTVTLTLIADCDEETVVTISGDQPGNEGPDDVTINCIPAEPTPTPTPEPTNTPKPTNTPAPPSATPQPPAAPVNTPISQVETVIQPPNTGDAGLAR